ncbi:hypothetical protein ACFPME_15600 [Rhodanobacter umsongensis]|uniref:Haem-binding uptake Tiki superfamily ChaN domain-containing protein n=1 Tax=Rhodanobacter umsongensis TaxID=633153 RepID=A0ABW0JQF5_9GAMM
MACVEARAAPAPPPAPQSLLGDLQPLKQELSRYTYLVGAIPGLSKSDQPMAQQLLASAEAELGLYSEAVRDFPLRTLLPAGLTLPNAADWHGVDAADAIVALARDRRLVMVNEAHHDAHTRALTLALLPRLRAMGFTHFAAEALDERDAGLMQRGYPVRRSGSEYLREPLYGDIVREAIRLGYIIVPYDTDGTPQAREDGQAKNLYERVFAGNPHAKLFVHAGYAHIDKQRGRLGPVEPMAMQLAKLSGVEALSIDQTDIREENPRSEELAYHAFLHALKKFETILQPMQPRFGSGPGDVPQRPASDAYAHLIAEFHPAHAIVLLRNADQVPWSARPGVYDLNVILPPANTVSSDYSQGPIVLNIDHRRTAILPPANGGHRPDWLPLGDQRIALPIDSGFCAGNYPCMVEADYAAESADAVAADRYVFLQKAKNSLYLRPGRYRLRTVNVGGHTLDERDIRIAQP